MTRPVRAAALSLAVLGLVLSGCAYEGEEPAYNGAYYGSLRLGQPHLTVREKRLDPDAFEVWGRARTIPVEIHGNPLAMTQAAFDDLVLERMQPARWKPTALRPSLTFVPAPETADSEVRIVAAFEYAEGAAFQDFCRSRAVPIRPNDGDTLTMRFVLCRGDEVLSSARTDIWGSGADVELRFQHKVSDATLALFPYRDRRPGVIATPSGLVLDRPLSHRHFGVALRRH